MNPSLASAVQILAYIGMVVGLAGAVVPVLPGAALIWASALAWAWADRFEHVGWPTLLVMGVLAGLSAASNIALSALGARQSGASWRGLAIASLCAILGFIFFNIIGALAGAALGMLAWEAYRLGWDWQTAWRASRGVLCGYLLSSFLQFIVAVLMIALFAWQAFGLN